MKSFSKHPLYLCSYDYYHIEWILAFSSCPGLRLDPATESMNNNTSISAVVKVETDSTVVFTFTNTNFAQKKKRNCLNDHCFFP